MSSAGGPAAGWYDDPGDATMSRWWDGEQWSSRIRPKASSAPPPSGGPIRRPAPANGYGSTVGNTLPPPNYLPQAILTTLFCCLPFGVVAIVKSTQVNSLWQTGQSDAAYAA